MGKSLLSGSSQHKSSNNLKAGNLMLLNKSRTVDHLSSILVSSVFQTNAATIGTNILSVYKLYQLKCDFHHSTCLLTHKPDDFLVVGNLKALQPHVGKREGLSPTNVPQIRGVGHY